MALKLMYITNNPDVALIAEKYGVERIWIDLETLGKEERQHKMDTVKSNHTVKDIRKISPLLTKSEMLVRINPWNEYSQEEIDSVITAGADMVMLPMWKTVGEVENFLMAVNGRVKTTLLLETKEAEVCLDDVLKLEGIDEIHIGLNDLSLSYGLNFMFELLANGTVERICGKIKQTGRPYGFGGIARIGEGVLPAEKIVMEHYRLGSTRAILSRSFCDVVKVIGTDEINKIFKKNINKLREYEHQVASVANQAVFEQNREDISQCVEEVVSNIIKNDRNNYEKARIN